MGDIFDQVSAKPTGDIFDQVTGQGAQATPPAPRSLLDHLANDPNTIPLDSYTHATEHGIASIGQGVAQAIQGTGQLLRHPIDTLKGMATSAAALPSQAAALIKDPPTLGQIGDVAGQTAGQIIPAVALHEAPGVTQDAIGMIPSRMRAAAGQLFQQVTDKAGNFPVDVEAPGKIAFDLKTQYQRGAGYTPPPVITRFLNRVTQPDAPPLTYAEARDFYSNATRLSADQAMKLSPKGKAMLGQFTSSLGQSIQNAANDAGVGAEHAQAMANYAKAMRYADNLDALKQVALKRVGQAAGGAATTAIGYETYKALKDQ